ncbi:MAG: alpha/beta fold hydrolase [Lachnospiraceae bacterium]|nr:alpha/beta fold hydrolase [Lachnospiraceae bacterium]
MREREFFLPSSDHNFKLRCMEWIPEGEVKAVLQIAHGMTEHIGRYREFAVWLAEHGVAVIGHDHLGHGKTVEKEEDFGFFGTNGGTEHVIKDMRRLTVYGKKKFPEVKLFLLGHSMGSFMVRRYLSVYHDGPDGFILMGTGAPAEAMVFGGYVLASMMSKVKGERYRSKLLYEMSLGSYNRKFKPTKTPQDWLTRDETWAKSFGEDELCQFVFTATAYRDFFRVILLDAKAEKEGKVRVDAPMLIVSGDKDPVGDDAKGVRKVYKRYSDAGVVEMTLGLYEGARHEILHETNCEEVFGDILEWIEQYA